jgi:hypothetical protein
VLNIFYQCVQKTPEKGDGIRKNKKESTSAFSCSMENIFLKGTIYEI